MATAEHYAHGELMRRAAAARAARIQLARQDSLEFNSLVLKDEQTGNGITQAPVHEKMHRLIKAHDRLALWSHIESGKSSSITVGHTLWTLGRDPNKRVVIVSNTAGQASKLVRTIARYIEQSAELKQVFPKLEKDEPWTSTQLFVKRTTKAKDPSVQATGVRGNIVGSRVDLLILDDVLDFENTRTEQAREELMEWFNASLGGRLTADARVIAVGTAWHPDDLMHRLSKGPTWHSARFPVLDEAGAITWPERWPLSRIMRRQEELGPVEYARQLMCVARDDSTARFQKAWIDVALKRGNGKEMAFALNGVPAGCKIYTGVDLAVQQTKKSDLTVLSTLLIHPNGDREVLNIESGRLSGPQIIEKIVNVHRRFQSIIIVENNASQDFIRQFLTVGSGIPVKPFTTGRNKVNPEFGVESIAAEMAAGKWIIPNKDGVMEPDIQAFVNGMLYYDPNAHTSDHLMATWIAREASRVAPPKKASSGRLDLMRR